MWRHITSQNQQISYMNNIKTILLYRSYDSSCILKVFLEFNSRKSFERRPCYYNFKIIAKLNRKQCLLTYLLIPMLYNKNFPVNYINSYNEIKIFYKKQIHLSSEENFNKIFSSFFIFHLYPGNLRRTFLFCCLV